MIDSVVIVSGGMDSVTLLHYLVKNEKRNPAVITFAYGQKHNKEISCAKSQVELLGIENHLVLDLAILHPLFASSALVRGGGDIPDVLDVMGDPQPVTYVPNRNMIFLALATAYAETHEVEDVFYGAQLHDIYGYWDTTAQFLDQLNQVYKLNRKNKIKVKAPFVSYSKTDILRKGIELEVDFGQTWSCYEGKEKACGRCSTCTERLKAFDSIGIIDPLPYTGVLL